MDKKVIIIALLTIISLTFIIILGINLASKNNKIGDNMLDKYEIINNLIPEEGLVPDKETAEKIAEIILEKIYGKTVSDKKPFEVEYDNEYNAWIVRGTLKSNEIGGVPNIIIQKSDGKIKAVWHTK